MTGTVFITDGTERIDLNNCGRIYIKDWSPFVPGAKGGGTWRDSSLAPGRQLVDWQWENWVDVFTLGMHNFTQDGVIRQEQDLQRLLVKAHQYWTTEWQSEPVWLEANAPCETNIRYAIIKSWRAPQGSGNPFQQPFSAVGHQKSVIDNFQLTIEHGPWLSDEPGTGRCVAINGLQESYPFHLIFDEATSEVNCGSNAALDDLPIGDFTAEGWFRAETWGLADPSYLFNKDDWFISISGTTALIRAFADYTVQDGDSRSTIGDFLADDAWHHVAVVFTDPGPAFRIWIDGVEVTYTLQDIVLGAYVGDAADDLYIGNDVGGASAFDGRIGWCRISNNARYNVNFTPPPRCVLPAIDGNTIAQWIGPENSGATIDNQEGTAALDGTQTDCEFDVACEFGRDDTCLEEVYVANKHNRAQLTHIFVDDGGAFGGNLINAATPFNLLPAVPVANDAVYFGIDTTFDDSGPFCSLVFDIGTAISGVTGLAWEYWNGAWVVLGVQDNTDANGAGTGVAFDTTGVNSVHWNQPSDWATVAVNGVTGYWVRARVTVAAGATAPTQQNRDVYTILWPRIGVDSDNVLGDIESLLQFIFRRQDNDDIERVIAGLRSEDRGEDFDSHINWSDEQNQPGITVSVGANTAFANDVESATGRIAVYSPVGAVEAPVPRVNAVLTPTLAADFFGRYRLFLRAQRDGGTADDFSGYVVAGFRSSLTGIGPIVFQSEDIDFESVVHDLGELNLSQDILAGSDVQGIIFYIVVETDAAAALGDVNFYDLILIPIDEWAIDSVTPDPATLEVAENKQYLDIDSITYPRRHIASIAKTGPLDTTADLALGSFQSITPSSAMLQANANQFLYFFWISQTAKDFTRIEHGASIQSTYVARYLYARGDR